MLHGSRARRIARVTSDWDIAILSHASLDNEQVAGQIIPGVSQLQSQPVPKLDHDLSQIVTREREVLVTVGSVIEKQDRISPAASGRSHCAFCSSLATTSSRCMLPSSGAAQLSACGPSSEYLAASNTTAIERMSSPRPPPLLADVWRQQPRFLRVGHQLALERVPESVFAPVADFGHVDDDAVGRDEHAPHVGHRFADGDLQVDSDLDVGAADLHGLTAVGDLDFGK